MKLTFRLKGGKGSGHHGHAGRPGDVGGSVPGKSGSASFVPVHDVWHATNVEHADYIAKHGFSTSVRSVGMSSVPEASFTFVSPVKAGARYYGKDNIRYSGEYKLVPAKVHGKLYDVKSRVADYEAYGEIAKMYGLYDAATGGYDISKLAAALRVDGYAGFTFRDALANGRIVWAVLPDALHVDESRAVSKCLN